MYKIEDIASKGEMFDSHYKLLRPLSTAGGSADVWLALDMNTIDWELDEEEGESKQASEDTGMLVAIKIYRPKNALDIDGEQQFREEFKIVYECRHSNLVQPTSFSIFKGIPYLVLPYCRQGSSEKFIGKKLPDAKVWQFVADVSAGLDKLHNNNPMIVHQDIKPANVLIDNNNHFAITDFGISSKNGDVHGYYPDGERSGTFAYMAPERFVYDAEPIPESDIWAFGATLCEILTGNAPFGVNGGHAQHPNGDNMPELKEVPEHFRRLILACLAYNPRERPTAAYLMEAANVRQYPIMPPRKKWWRIPLQILILCLIAAGAYYIANKERDVNTELETEPKPSTEELYQIALKDLNEDNKETVEKGLALMDSLAATKYIPAMYQVALTLGWFGNEDSKNRKRILGIEVDESGITKDPKYGTTMANLLERILEINDSSYPKINMDAAYQLGVYYNRTYLNAVNNTISNLEKSRSWAYEALKDTCNNIDSIHKRIKIIDKSVKELKQFKSENF